MLIAHFGVTTIFVQKHTILKSAETFDQIGQLKLGAHQCHYFHCSKMTSNVRAIRFCTVNIPQSDNMPIQILIMQQTSKLNVIKHLIKRTLL